MIEDFNEGRIQFAFVKVKDPNSGLPKSVLIAWCGGGVPERTKGYFTSHLAAVSKVLHGYHVQITARSDSDLEPDSIMQKVADASGAKYSAGSSSDARGAAPPPIKSKPVFTPTTSSRSVNPIIAARSRRDENVDADGWGADAPPVTRTQLEKVDSAYKPTKVNLADLTKQSSGSSYTAPKRDDTPSDVVRGGYQPIGKVDIAAIRAQAQKTGDDRPTPVKGAYEPVGKVDIAAIRARAQKPADETPEPEPKPVSERMAAFSQPAQSERLTSLPKPKVAKKLGGGSTFTGTKAPTPGGFGFGSPAAPSAAPVGAASRTFADQGGKTPAQLWAEKKARERGSDVASPAASTTPSIPAQKSGGEWKSGYSGKSWAPVQTSGYGGAAAGHVSQQNTGEETARGEEPPAESSGGVSALRDRFKDTAPIGAPPPPTTSASRGFEDDEPSRPPVIPESSRPSGGFALPGLPSRPAPAEEEEEAEDPNAYRTAAEVREPSPEPEREPSPIRVAVPVSRGPVPPIETPEEERAPPPLPPSQIVVPKEEDLPSDDEVAHTARAAGHAVAQQSFQPEPVQPAREEQEQGGEELYRALILYDYEVGEDGEIALVEGQYVVNVQMASEDWWMGTNSKGQSGLFPSNYVEIVEEKGGDQQTSPPPPPAPTAGPTATAIYYYEAAEPNGKSSRWPIDFKRRRC